MSLIARTHARVLSGPNGPTGPNGLGQRRWIRGVAPMISVKVFGSSSPRPGYGHSYENIPTPSNAVTMEQVYKAYEDAETAQKEGKDANMVACLYDIAVELNSHYLKQYFVKEQNHLRMLEEAPVIDDPCDPLTREYDL